MYLAILVAFIILFCVIAAPIIILTFAVKGVMLLLGCGIIKALIIIFVLDFVYEICKAIIEVTTK